MRGKAFEESSLLDSGFGPDRRGLFLEEMVAAARDHMGALGTGVGGPNEGGDLVSEVQALITQLGKEVVQFSENLDVRRNRIALVREVQNIFAPLADFTKLS